jgi:hypothetical protein
VSSDRPLRVLHLLQGLQTLRLATVACPGRPDKVDDYNGLTGNRRPKGVSPFSGGARSAVDNFVKNFAKSVADGTCGKTCVGLPRFELSR